MKISGTATVAQLHTFDEIIDVRSPAEFGEDHIPGAINCPVLSNEERAMIGTLHRQVSAFAARRQGAVLISRRISQHLEESFSSKPIDWRPIVYCWRGGNRSKAMVHVMNQIGWKALQLEGGYRTYRQHVLHSLEELPNRFHFQILCGATGTGKSHIITLLHEQGEQVIDLEGLANHRGSVLGKLPGAIQPSQKCFESMLYQSFINFDHRKIVYIESESRKIGKLQLPTSLLKAMWDSPCIQITAPIEARATLLLNEYAHLVNYPDLLEQALNRLFIYYGHQKVNNWLQLIKVQEFYPLVVDLLKIHYDPAYQKTLAAHYKLLPNAITLNASTLDSYSLNELLNSILLLKRNAIIKQKSY
ncbi:MAG: tRNA 2-selenouridine(34) synthase MnmH [Proteobacteria bacterium]|nr:tRNA 2-selenouridine(34) synthase MnmH [Pseudomonadota bacterium]